jgi:hypothetical protein
VKHLLDVVHNLFKPTLREAFLHLWLHVSSDLLSDGGFGFRVL